VPFRTFTWEDGLLKLGRDEPRPALRQIGEKSFLLLESFCYHVPARDPDSGMVYVIPGRDEEPNPDGRRTTTVPDAAGRSHCVVVPPSDGGKTDLASVPSFMWWLVASYGNHTRAALLHDALYVEKPDVPPVTRPHADRLFLTALREPAQKKGVFRHWLMWAAVCAFGSGRFLGGVLAVNALAIWGLAVGGAAWAWGPSLWPASSSAGTIALSAVVFALIVAFFLMALGGFWRLGVDIPRGWLAPVSVLGALVLVPLGAEWPSPFTLDWSPFTLLFPAGILVLVGLLWGFKTAPPFRWWLWPTTLLGLPIALIPVILIMLATGLIWCLDFGAAVAVTATRRKDQNGRRRTLEVPSFNPFRVAL
jgi:hypothetical protein